MLSNNDFLLDEDGDDSDWIERNYATTTCIDLLVSSLSDAAAFTLAFKTEIAGRCKLKRYDLSGRCLYSAFVFAQPGSNAITLYVWLAHGMYLLQLSTHAPISFYDLLR